MAEGEIKRKKFDITMTSAEAFKVLAPQLVTAERRVGFVPHAHATTAMLDPGFKQAVFLTDEEDLDEALHEHVTDSTGGVLFRVVVQEPAGGGRLQPSQGQGRVEVPGQGLGQGAGGGGGGAGAQGGGGARLTAYQKLLQSGQPVHLPEPKKMTAARGNVPAKPVKVGLPSSELAYNHAIESLRRHDILFHRKQVSFVWSSWAGVMWCQGASVD
jgi:hypothetical protein